LLQILASKHFLMLEWIIKMAKNELEMFKGSVGITLTFQTKIPLTNTTDMKLKLKVGATLIERDLTEANINTTTGDVTYTTQEGDLDIVGKYKGQVIDVTEGVYIPSQIFEFKVVDNVE
jgi:hypothetical protein